MAVIDQKPQKLGGHKSDWVVWLRTSDNICLKVQFGWQADAARADLIAKQIASALPDPKDAK